MDAEKENENGENILSKKIKKRGAQPEYNLTKPYDAVMKSLFDANAPLLLKLININAETERMNRLELPNLAPELIADLLIDTKVNGQNSLVHVEFQTANDNEMPFRMGEYAFRIIRIHKTKFLKKNYKLIQIVIYIGSAELSMPDSFEVQYNQENLVSGVSVKYILIDVKKLDARPFFEKNDLNANLFGLLTDLSKLNKEIFDILRDIAFKISNLRKDEEKFLEFLTLFLIIAHLRNLDYKLKEVLELANIKIDLLEIPFIKEEHEKRLRKAKEEGIKLGKEQGIKLGKEQGKLKALHDAIKDLLNNKFKSADIQQIYNKIRKIKDVKKLKEILISLGKATEFDEFKRSLNKLNDDIKKHDGKKL